MDYRKKIVKECVNQNKLLKQKKLTIQTFSNVSIRLNDNYFTIKPSGVSPEEIILKKCPIIRVSDGKKIAGSYTSGRFALWKNALERYEKNRFFGYGPQADRIMLFDPTDFDSGNNVSNTMIYGLLSGGYFSLTILIVKLN